MRSENSLLGGLLCIHASFIASISLTYIALGPSEACQCQRSCFVLPCFKLSSILYCYFIFSHLSLLHGFLALHEDNSDSKSGGSALATFVIATWAVSCVLFGCVESMGIFAAVIGLFYGIGVHVLGFYLSEIH